MTTGLSESVYIDSFCEIQDLILLKLKSGFIFPCNFSNAEFGMVSSRKSKWICRAVLYVRTYFLEYLRSNFKIAKIELRSACGINSHKMEMKGEESVIKQL